jgi:hypothetical protein
VTTAAQTCLLRRLCGSGSKEARTLLQPPLYLHRSTRVGRRQEKISAMHHKLHRRTIIHSPILANRRFDNPAMVVNPRHLPSPTVLLGWVVGSMRMAMASNSTWAHPNLPTDDTPTTQQRVTGRRHHIGRATAPRRSKNKRRLALRVLGDKHGFLIFVLAQRYWIDGIHSTSGRFLQTAAIPYPASSGLWFEFLIAWIGVESNYSELVA